MADIININFKYSHIPDIVSTGHDYEIAKKRSVKADPITDEVIVAEVSESFKSRGKYRDNLLFILGCNCGLRCGEIVSLRWGHLINSDGSFKDVLTFVEQKTSKINKETGETKLKVRKVDIGPVVHDALELHLRNCATIDLNDYIFKSEATTKDYYAQKRKNTNREDHLSVRAVDKILKRTVNEILGYDDIHASTHVMRKTFARFIYENAPDERAGIKFVQSALGHASVDSTLKYIGVTDEEMRAAVTGLNLGKRRANGGVKSIEQKTYNVKTGG